MKNHQFAFTATMTGKKRRSRWSGQIGDFLHRPKVTQGQVTWKRGVTDDVALWEITNLIVQGDKHV